MGEAVVASTIVHRIQYLSDFEVVGMQLASGTRRRGTGAISSDANVGLKVCIGWFRFPGSEDAFQVVIRWCQRRRWSAVLFFLIWMKHIFFWCWQHVKSESRSREQYKISSNCEQGALCGFSSVVWHDSCSRSAVWYPYLQCSYPPSSTVDRRRWSVTRLRAETPLSASGTSMRSVQSGPCLPIDYICMQSIRLARLLTSRFTVIATISQIHVIAIKIQQLSINIHLFHL